MDQLRAIRRRGISLACKGNWGEEPMHVAAGRGNMEVVQFLVHNLGYEAIGARDSNQKTPVHYGATRPQISPYVLSSLLSAARNRQLQMVQWLVAHGDIGGGNPVQSWVDYKGRTALDVCNEVVTSLLSLLHAVPAR